MCESYFLQGKLFYGDENMFHNGVFAVLGQHAEDISVGTDVVVMETLLHGRMEDKYNVWYLRYCPAREQNWYDEKGELRLSNVKQGGEEGTPSIASAKVVDQGHSGITLSAFTASVNMRLRSMGVNLRVTDAQVLSLRMYTASTFAWYNGQLRGKGMKDVGIDCSRSISCARQCLIRMQAIGREPQSPGDSRHTENTYRGVTGKLGSKFLTGGMGMDFAFFSTSASIDVAVEFTQEVAHKVIFEVVYVPACPGVNVEAISVFPGEKEILYPPCTGLSLSRKNQDAISNVVVIPSSAMGTRIASDEEPGAESQKPTSNSNLSTT